MRRSIGWLAVALLAAGLALFVAGQVRAMSGSPEQFECGDAEPINDRFDLTTCTIDKAPYVPPTASVPYPVGFITPNPLPADRSLRLKVRLTGYNARPGVPPYRSNCTGVDGSEPGYMVVKLCAGHYPDHSLHQVQGVQPFGWLAWYLGDSNGMRAGLALSKAAFTFGPGRPVDVRAGVIWHANGYGATGALLQSMILPDPFWRAATVAVHATLPHTLPVSDQSGLVNQNPDVALAWQGADLRTGDFALRAAAGDIEHIYYRLHGSTVDNLVRFDTRIFEYCDRYRVACFGTWHAGGHNLVEPGVDLPYTDLFAGPDSDVRLDRPLPVFTESTANHAGARGHYNLGLSWHAGAGLSVTADRLEIPVRYNRVTDIGGGVPDQPGAATFRLTLRRLGALKVAPGEQFAWSVAGTSGIVTASRKGELSIPDITLQSSLAYQVLEVERIAPSAEFSLVYTRQPRARTPVANAGIEEAATWQRASDVGRINMGIAEADVVLDNLAGEITVIHNCTDRAEACVAHEARVSPDGTKIAYSVGYASSLVPTIAHGVHLGLGEIAQLERASIWLYDIATGERREIPAPAGAIDRQPEWLDNEHLVFATNRAGVYPYKNQFPVHFGLGRCFNPPYCVSQEYGYTPAGKSMQIWRMRIDGSEAVNLTPHEQNALSPAVMSNGDILYSCWNAHGNRAHDSKTSIGPSTSKNKWWLCRMDGNGADGTVILNAHKTLTLKTSGWLTDIKGGEGRSQLRAIRSVAEIFTGRLAISNYYRSNHVGSMGIVYGMDYRDPHVEGCSTSRCVPHSLSNSDVPGSGRYVPSTLTALTPYGTDQDQNDARRGPGNRIAGKAGYPAPLPHTDREYMITHAKGMCYDPMPLRHANRAWMGGEPTCQKGAYRVKVERVTDPFDPNQLEPLAVDDRFHIFDARAVAPYAAFHNQVMPDLPPPHEPGECNLQIVDARAAELAPYAAYDWIETRYSQCNTQGCAINTESSSFHADTIAAVGVYLPELWRHTYAGPLREIYRANRNTNGFALVRAAVPQPLEADGSLRMQVPCDTPLQISGVDGDGLLIAHDQTLHSLRPGETRTCHGCHDGHSEERAAELKLSAVERFASTQAARKPAREHQVLGGLTFADIEPILERRCVGCHSDMNNGDGLLYDRLVWDHEQIDWPGMPRKRGPDPQKPFSLARPNVSKWVTNFARDSLLYWKCLGERADGRTDSAYNNDIDFGLAHVSGATRAECTKLGRWIDLGAQS